MEYYLYSPYELALIIQFYGMDIVTAIQLLNDIFKYDNAFIYSEYRSNQKKFVLDVMAQINSINNHEQFENEKYYIEKDMEQLGLLNGSENNEEESMLHHLIFKELRIRILYVNQKKFAKMKLRTLLSELGYKRRSQNNIAYIRECMLFYHIDVFLKGNVYCDIENVDIDDMLVFRVI
ncbi:MAG: hypothetical protein ACI4JM_07325 [Oscillospiraceae bacterium]